MIFICSRCPLRNISGGPRRSRFLPIWRTHQVHPGRVSWVSWAQG